MIQLFRSHRAKSWPTVKAEVTTSERARGAGCIVVELSYKYRMDGEPYNGDHAEPFLWAGSAKDYFDRHSVGSEIIVRVEPGAPESSVVRDKDLYFYARGYQLDS